MTALATTLPPKPCDVPIDTGYLEKQVPGLTSDHMAYYLINGLKDRVDPTPWFVTDWYAWQNPDWHHAHRAPYLHYLQTGRFEGRDPSPYVDIYKYRHSVGAAVPVEAIYGLILKGHHCTALGVTNPTTLRQQQAAFLDGIQSVAHRMRPLRKPRRGLVVLQAGRGSLAGRWFQDVGRDWDLLVNYYDAVGFRPGFGDYTCFQKGTKFTAMWHFLKQHAALFRPYEHVLFLDDDVETSVRDLNRLFKTCRRHALDLAQMTLSADSSCNWPELFHQPNQTGPRPVSAVEIMMPIFSQKALQQIAPTLGQSVSGFGLDLVWGKCVADTGGKIAVLDDVVAAHRRPVDQSDGAYYSYLRSAGINAKAELWALLNTYGAARDVVTQI
ncbi:DUF707 domain-containing protein [bacterium]|nr:DUF707 domain-containing protein [bacterium]